MTIETSQLFELDLVLPDHALTQQARTLIGFQERYDRLQRDIRVLLDQEGLAAWSERFYQKQIPLVTLVTDRYPLVIFYGDVGTGKTAMAETIANALTRELHKDGRLFKLSTRVRGIGQVGQMSTLINQAFEIITKEAGKTRLAFLILDEADSLAGSRESEQSHHEDKVAVNTLIQKIDQVRRLGGRVLVFLCTNRFGALDPAIVRRAGRIEHFERPNAQEREGLLRLDCAGLGLSEETLLELVQLTGSDAEAGRNVGYTFSDFRTRFFPEVIARAYPERQLEAQDFLSVAQTLVPSPSIEA